MMKKGTVLFFKEKVIFRLMNREKLQQWIRKAVKQEGYNLGCINFIFCSDPYLRKLNKDYLKHDYFTDIVTFDNSSEKKLIEGDIFISIDRVRINAALYNVSFKEELQRVMIHGVLHLTGYTDKNSKEKMNMRKREDFWLMKRGF